MSYHGVRKAVMGLVGVGGAAAVVATGGGALAVIPVVLGIAGLKKVATQEHEEQLEERGEIMRSLGRQNHYGGGYNIPESPLTAIARRDPKLAADVLEQGARLKSDQMRGEYAEAMARLAVSKMDSGELDGYRGARITIESTVRRSFFGNETNNYRTSVRFKK